MIAFESDFWSATVSCMFSFSYMNTALAMLLLALYRTIDLCYLILVCSTIMLIDRNGWIEAYNPGSMFAILFLRVSISTCGVCCIAEKSYDQAILLDYKEILSSSKCISSEHFWTWDSLFTLDSLVKPIVELMIGRKSFVTFLEFRLEVLLELGFSCNSVWLCFIWKGIFSDYNWIVLFKRVP